MKKLLLVSFFILTATFVLNAQQKITWEKVNKLSIPQNQVLIRENTPEKFSLFKFDLDILKSVLSDAPSKKFINSNSTKIVDFINPSGKAVRFNIFENSIMESGLANRYANIKTYVGTSVNDSSETIYFSITDFGFHLISFSNYSETYYIDTYSKDKNTVIAYFKKDINKVPNFQCDVTEDFERNLSNSIATNSFRASDGKFRTYRLAMACTIEYAAFHVNAAGLSGGTLAQKKSAVLSAMIVTMNRVNGLFEKDMSLKMNLVANNDAIIFIDSDTFDNATAGTLINQSQTVIDATIGAANYDIGHTVSTGGGGLAQLYSPCSTSKARGITGQGAPVGDPFDIDFVAHEMGHQFGANHTQNNNCNRSSASVEPGSATTIMGYAGICSPNVQSNSDVHFNAISIAEMSSFIAGAGGSCPVTTTNGNFAPSVNAGVDYTIPKGTAFVLKGRATDANNDSLTYCWEQQNAEPSTQPPTNTATVGPNFRSLPPQVIADRYMPNLASIIGGNLSPTWEVIPNVARTMNFALTVRDNRTPNGGQTGRDDMILNIANTGPFIITAPNTNVSFNPLSNQIITWDVAGTIANGIDCAFVDIYSSSNGGTSFPILLASKVPNDGSEIISVPNTIGTSNRILIQGNNHIFLDVTNTNFTIANPTATFGIAFSGIAGEQNKTICQSGNASFDINYTTLLGFSNLTNLAVIGNPAGSIAAFSQSSINTTGIVSLNITNTQLCTPGVYTLVVTGTSGAVTKTVNFYLEVLNSTFDVMTLTSPANLSFAIPTATTLTWVSNPAASNYDVQVATDDAFGTIIRNDNIVTNSYAVSGLSAISNYFWRIKPKNSLCAGIYSDVYRFTTGQKVCANEVSTNIPLAISSAGTPTINSTITIPFMNGVLISDINVSVQITHTWVSDLIITLISPTGTQIELINSQCTDQNNINVSFDDLGSTLVCGANPAISGTIRASQLLSILNGENSSGIWTLRVFDKEAGDGGALTNWSLNICTVPNVPITCGQIATAWDGNSWSNGRPVDNVTTTISGNYNAITDLKACALNITNNAQVTISSGNNLIVKGAVNVETTANLILENNANLIQIDNIPNTGSIVVKRSTSALKRLDYVNWSSPVFGAQTLKQFSPLTLTNRFYNFSTPANVYTAVTNPLTNTFTTGKGYLIRMPDNHPTAPTIFSGQFTGTPNNGTLDVNIIYAGLNNSFNLVGNPYPSTINASDFLTSNSTTINGVLYFWRKTNAAAGTAYATYSLGGATTTSPTSPTPNGIIQVGQGFLVEAKNVTIPKITFSNALRIGNNFNQFFRQESSIFGDKIWLNLTNSSDAFSQILVGFDENATNNADANYDAKGISDSPLAFGSFINSEVFVIQNRAIPFQSAAIFPLHFKTDVSSNYAIAIDHVEGLFAGDQNIYLKDNLTQTITNLKSNSYNFYAQAGIFNSRFELVFQENSLLATSFKTNNTVNVSSSNGQIKINSHLDNIKKIKVFDVLGRQLFGADEINSKLFVLSSLIETKQTLLLKITLEAGIIQTTKIIF